MNLQQKASKAAELSHACTNSKILKLCTLELSNFCRNSKGYKVRKKDEKEHIGSILHSADESVGSEKVYMFFQDVRVKNLSKFGNLKKGGEKS